MRPETKFGYDLSRELKEILIKKLNKKYGDDRAKKIAVAGVAYGMMVTDYFMHAPVNDRAEIFLGWVKTISEVLDIPLILMKERKGNESLN